MKIFKLTIIVFLLLVVFSNLILASEIKLPPYQKSSLGNDLTLLVMENKKLPLVNFRLVIKAGSVYDPVGKEGLANLTATLIRKGTKAKSFEQISEEIEFVGGSLNSGASPDYAFISGEFLSKDVDLALHLLSDILLNSVFSQEEFEREKELTLAGLQEEKDDPSTIATKAFYQFLFEKNPYSHPVDGTETSLKNITREDVVNFYKKYFVPQYSILTLVGDFSSQTVKQKVENALAGWQKSNSNVVKISPPAKFKGRKLLIVEKPDVTQTQIRIGNISVPRNNPDYFPVVVANTILGGGFSSRLVNEIRVNQGLTYGVSSRFNMFKETGAYVISTFTKNKTTRKTIDVALAEVKKFREKGVSSDELAGAKNYLKGLFPSRLQTPEALASQISDIEFYNLDSKYVDTYMQKIDAVTLDDIKRVANKYFDYQDVVFVVVTNPKETKKDLEGLGKIEMTKP